MIRVCGVGKENSKSIIVGFTRNILKRLEVGWKERFYKSHVYGVGRR